MNPLYASIFRKVKEERREEGRGGERRGEEGREEDRRGGEERGEVSRGEGRGERKEETEDTKLKISLAPA